MNRRLLAGRALILVAALVILASRGARAGDPTSVEFILGSWAGFSQSSAGPGPIQNSFFDIFATQQHRRFMGAATLALGDGSVRFLCDGSVSQANVLNVQGKSTDGLIIVVCHGKTATMADGSVRIAALQYQLDSLRGNLLDQGFLLLVQRAGGINWSDLNVPAVQDCWDGSWTSAITDGTSGPADLMVDTQLGSALGGTLEFDTTPTADRSGPLFLGPFQGTITLPAVQDGISKKLVIGADSAHGIIAILIGLLLPAVQTPGVDAAPPQLEGRYMLFHGLADVFAGVWRGSNTSFDQGEYSMVPAVQ